MSRSGALRLVVGILLISPVGVSAATVPRTTDWIDRGLVIDTGAHGEAWDVLMEGLTPCSVVKRGDTFYLYYVGSPDYVDDPANIGPRARAIGVATSTDLIHWTKHAGNPVIVWSASGNPEEGAPSAGVHVDGTGQFVAYYGANSSSNPTDPLVWADLRLATSADGLTFADQGMVVSHTDRSVYGHGDELHSNIAFEHNGKWYAYYIPNGTPQAATLGVAYGSDRAQLASSARVSSGGGSVRARGPASVVRIGPNTLAFFISYRDSMDVRTTTLDRLTELSAPVATYSGAGIVYLDTARKTWFRFYNAWTHIGLATAAMDGVVDISPPTAPPAVSSVELGHDALEIRWSPADDPDTGVLEYKISRNGQLLATTRDLAYRDTGLTELTAYSYEVRAVNLHGVEGPAALLDVTTPADVTPPRVARIRSAGDPSQVIVHFDEPVEVTSAANAANYSIPGVTVLEASLGEDLTTVTLRTTSQTDNVFQTLSALGISDRASSPNAGDSQLGYTHSRVAGLVAYWRLDEADGEIVTDSSGSGNHGRAKGGPARGPGRIGGAFAFDGADDHVSLPDTTVLDAAVSQSFTFAAGLHPTAVPPATTTANWAYTLFKGPNVRIHFDRDRRLSARIRTSDGDVELRSDPFAPGSWHHAAVAVDDVAQQLFVFVDGQPVTGSPLSFTGHILPAPRGERGNWPEYAGRHWIGATSPGYTGDGDSNMFDGWIDDARLYERALTEAEVDAIMQPVGAPLVTIAHVSSLRPYALAIARAGAVQYVDRSYVIRTLPPTLDGGVLVRTANDDKLIAVDAHLTLVLGQSADVFVCYDARATRRPTWLADGSWSDTGLVVTTSDVASRVYAKRMPAGNLTLGGNHAGGNTLAKSNYYVVVTPVPAVAPSRALAEMGLKEGSGPSHATRK